MVKFWVVVPIEVTRRARISSSKSFQPGMRLTDMSCASLATSRRGRLKIGCFRWRKTDTVYLQFRLEKSHRLFFMFQSDGRLDVFVFLKTAKIVKTSKHSIGLQAVEKESVVETNLENFRGLTKMLLPTCSQLDGIVKTTNCIYAFDDQFYSHGLYRFDGQFYTRNI